ncbi:hypothetical protein EG829_15965, partial [bacterium]|nr:hypothetical protein [bacterium]
MKPRNELMAASAAAVIATIGDVLMLLVANALRPEMDLSRPPEFVLAIGGMLGVAAIPFYALGYGAVARVIRPGYPVLSGIVLACGLGIAASGALIHGLTAFSIRAGMSSGSAVGPPMESIVRSGGILLAVWGFASLLVFAASIAILAAAGGSGTGQLPRWLSRLNPAVVTVILGAAGLPWELGRSFLLPAAPNLGHVVFFCAALHALFRNQM